MQEPSNDWRKPKARSTEFQREYDRIQGVRARQEMARERGLKRANLGRKLSKGEMEAQWREEEHWRKANEEKPLKRWKSRSA
jgi:hypothetical protein